MRRIYEEIVRLLSEKQTILLATVIQQTGSAPRTRGAQMLIRDDGSLLGTIGGGRLEADVLNEAQAADSQSRAKIMPFALTGQEVAESDMLCGGNVEVYLEPLVPTQPDLITIYTHLLEVIEARKTAALATLIDPTVAGEAKGTKLLITPDGTTLGSIEVAAEVMAVAQQVMAERVARLIPWRDGRLYLEPIFSEPTLYIFGAGHVSRYLARVATMLDFKVIVIDDRAEHANREHFPDVSELWVEEFDKVVQTVQLTDDSYVVIVTRGHVHDCTVLRSVLGKDAGYIGMIGSRRKRDLIYQQLRDEGFSQEQLDTVYAPIGLGINADTPEEVAVSIAAELIKVRAEARSPRQKDWEV